jgi:hypothetical protein
MASAQSERGSFAASKEERRILKLKTAIEDEIDVWRASVFRMVVRIYEIAQARKI